MIGLNGVTFVLQVLLERTTTGNLLHKICFILDRFVGINASDINITAGRYDPSAKFPIDTGMEVSLF